MGNKWGELQNRMRELKDLGGTLSLLAWDQAVMMPPKGGAARARTAATLEALTHSRLTDPRLGELLDEAAADDSLDDVRQRAVELLKRDYDKATKVPDDLVRELAEATNLAYQVWTEARPASDFGRFQPHLEKVVALKKQVTDAIGFANERYDALLDDYEPGMTAAEVEEMFAGLVKGLQPVADVVLAKSGSRPEFLTNTFDISAQSSFSQWLTRHIGFDTGGGRLDISPHPFTIQIGLGDVRQTTRYHESDLVSSIYSTLHESGHALYDQGLPEEWRDLPVGGHASLGMHESQSRMWENQVGRSRAFTAFLLPRLKERFENALGSVEPDDFYRAVNHPERSLIRVEADELTYNLHIVLRFEIELALFRDELEVADLPEAWDHAMETHLGIRPDGDSQGVLQDMHWSGGMMGYFPTYTLGTLYAAAFFAKARSDLGDLEDEFRRGETGRLLDWLRTNIHSKAHLHDAKDLAAEVLGEKPTAQPFLDYLSDKYSDIYGP
jgi:carboxypeptidase Taq